MAFAGTACGCAGVSNRSSAATLATASLVCNQLEQGRAQIAEVRVGRWCVKKPRARERTNRGSVGPAAVTIETALSVCWRQSVPS